MLLLLVAFSLALIRYEDEYDDDGGDWYSGVRPEKKQGVKNKENGKKGSPRAAKTQGSSSRTSRKARAT